MVQQILIDVDSVANAIRRIVAERSTVPEPGAIAQVEGTSVGVTSPFHAQLEYSAKLLSSIVTTVRSELETTQAAIRKAIEDAAENDAAQADEAKAILTALDSIVAQPAPSTSTSTTSTSTPPASTPGISKSW
ncbi:hypothetical protein GCM10027413_32000 [Conyzicola nivalis]|uniref:Uncharacterized protein n=1 Tax=Conyzicola nivalis TaxID=1477021 RepID=A0A916WMA3_9MICO|nr:hypothetical protein [Conyzicola nivalis]GGB11700.1 hypothetical protein GCM10010979_27520 [Conyzicola nivalis]